MRAHVILPVFLSVVLSVGLAPLARAMGDSTPPAVAANADADSGEKAIEARDWKRAIDSFNRAAAREPRNADFQNMLGFAWRKSGNAELAFKHYHEALRLNPGHRGAHEYIGEAYLMINNVSKAEEHLAVLDKLCRVPCAEFTELKNAIGMHRQRVAGGAQK